MRARAAAPRCLPWFLTCLAVLGCSPKGGEVVGGASADQGATKTSASEDAEKAEARERIRERLQADGATVNKNSLSLPPLPAVIATVDGQPIPLAAFSERYDPGAKALLERRGDNHIPGPFEATQRRKIIGELVYAKQLELEAARSGVDFTPEQMAKTEADERRHILDWDAWLARVGQTPEIRHQANIVYLRERALLAARVGPLEPTEDELRATYEQFRSNFVARETVVRASHLLITFGPRVGDEKIQPMTPEQSTATTADQHAQYDAAAKARAEALRALALEPGRDFHELAREYSEGPGAFRGGDMGLFPRRQMVAEYAEAAFALKPGQLSEPIRSEKGYYVIKSYGRYDEGPLPYEAVRDDLVRQVEGQKLEQARAALEAELDGRFVVVSPALDEAEAFLAK